MYNNKSGIKGRRAYNNGKVMKYFTYEDTIPEGFVLGGLASRSSEEYEDSAHKSSMTQKKTWKNKSKEEKEKWSEKCRDAQENMSEEAKQNKIDKTISTFKNKSKEELDDINRRRGNSVHNYWKELSNDEYTNKIDSKLLKTINTNMERYGVKYYCMTDECRSASSNDSIPNKKFAALLEKNHIEYEREFVLGNYSYDFKIGNNLIEIDPAATHNSTWGPFGDHTGLDTKYHFNKSLYAKNNNYRCIHIFDWEDPNNIISILKNRKRIYARKCDIKEIDNKQASIYLNEHHIQGKANASIRIGLFYNDELVSLMTFGKPRYNKNYQYELVRYCSHYFVVGGAEKIFSYFIDKYKPESIISYCDNSKFEGKVYTKLGFILDTYGSPSRHWFNMPEKIHITDNLLRQRGFDQLFGTEYGKGTSNNDLMLEAGFEIGRAHV